MINLPIIIESKLIEFCLIGPTGVQDGLLLRSSNLSINHLGFSNLAYFDRLSSFTNLERRPNKGFWSSGLVSNSIQHENREFKLLFTWKSKTLSYQTNRLKNIENDFNILAPDLFNICHSKSLSQNQKENSLSWTISPLIYIL